MVKIRETFHGMPPSPAAQGPSWWSAPGAVNERGCHWDRSSGALESTKPRGFRGEATAETSGICWAFRRCSKYFYKSEHATQEGTNQPQIEIHRLPENVDESPSGMSDATNNRKKE